MHLNVDAMITQLALICVLSGLRLMRTLSFLGTRMAD